jgi:peptidoglycan pentaglycine glycine transferase (the first glycine)
MSPMHVSPATDQNAWDAFVKAQPFSPFLQSWTMGEVYRDIGQEPVRLQATIDGKIQGICQAIVVPAKRGRHLMVQYGPLITDKSGFSTREVRHEVLNNLLHALKDTARGHRCSFIRMSPFWREQDPMTASIEGALPSPLHLLSEYTWYIPLKNHDRWGVDTGHSTFDIRTEDSIKMEMRKTTRNLVGRAEREGVTVEASKDPNTDLDLYFALQEETYKRHGFVPYRASYIRSQVKRFSPSGEAIVYVARYQGEPVAASVHMSFGGITSYHHGASTHKYAKIPASYLLQWTAIKEALRRGDDIYNFWGIAPRRMNEQGEETIINPKHPFAGVTTFKTGFGGKPLPLMHCVDVPLGNAYYMTRAFEFVRKWRRGF